MTFPVIQQPLLPPNTIVPENESLFIPYLNRLYEDIAFTANNKENIFFEAAITDVASDIPNLPNFGAYIICVCGSEPERNAGGVIIGWLPTLNASLVKSDATAAGVINVLGFQAGTGSWGANVLTITSTATNFQIVHSRAGVSGNFNIRIVATQ